LNVDVSEEEKADVDGGRGAKRLLEQSRYNWQILKTFLSTSNPCLPDETGPAVPEATNR
jgi:hypothetical protein